MQMKFKAIRLKAGENWSVVLTTPEGEDHQIAGFATAEEARSWIERETGQSVAGPGLN